MKVRPKISNYDTMIKETQAVHSDKVVHKANTRGSADHGWLKVNHSFSFAQWYNPEKVNFGALRVLNDDSIAADKGFGTHPHDNMEIITIPLSGELAHKDSMGNASTIKAGEIQVMSAGQGILHSEFNPSKTHSTSLFQIWIFPNKKNVQPRYDQFWMDVEGMKDNFLQLVSPDPNDEGAWIHQNAWIKMAKFAAGKSINYNLNSPENGVYTMIIDGKVKVEGESLGKRDAIGVWNKESIEFEALEDTHLLTIEVPMEFNI